MIPEIREGRQKNQPGKMEIRVNGQPGEMGSNFSRSFVPRVSKSVKLKNVKLD